MTFSIIILLFSSIICNMSLKVVQKSLHQNFGEKTISVIGIAL